MDENQSDADVAILVDSEATVIADDDEKLPVTNHSGHDVSPRELDLADEKSKLSAIQVDKKGTVDQEEQIQGIKVYPPSTTQESARSEVISTSYEETVTEITYAIGDDNVPIAQVQRVSVDRETTSSEDRPPVATTRPGAVHVPGIGPSTLVASSSMVSATDPMAEVERQMDASVTLGVTVSDQELEREFRNELLRDAVYASSVRQELVTSEQKRSTWVWLVAVCVVVVGVAIITGVFVANRNQDEENFSPTMAPAIPLSDVEIRFMDYFSSQMVDGGVALRNPDSVYAQVFRRIMNDPNRGNQIDEANRFALLVLFETTKGEEWINSENWNTSEAICSWHGVRCLNELLSGAGPQGLVSYLELPSNNLQGPLLPELGKMGWTLLDFSNNKLTGTIPEAYSELSGFSLVDFSGNLLSGSVPQVLCDVTFVGKIRVDCDSVACSCCEPCMP